jgi:hypothetical protein
LKNVDNDAKMIKDDAKQVANDTSKERQKKQGTNSDKHSLKMNSDDINTNNAKTVIGLKKVEGDPQIRNDNHKTVVNNASKELQKKVGKNSNKPSLKINSEDMNTNNVKTVIVLKKVEGDPQLRKDNAKTVANNASKELQKKVGKNSNKPSLKINSEDINTNVIISKTKQSTSQNDNVSILILIVNYYTEI